MRDIIVSMIIVGLMPTCYRRPFVGLVVFSWLDKDCDFKPAWQRSVQFYADHEAYKGGHAAVWDGRPKKDFDEVSVDAD